MDPEAKGARGLGAVYVKKDAPGVSFGPAETLMGFRGVPSADIYFEDVKIAPDDVLLPAVSGALFWTIMFWDPPLYACSHTAVDNKHASV